MPSNHHQQNAPQRPVYASSTAQVVDYVSCTKAVGAQSKPCADWVDATSM